MCRFYFNLATWGGLPGKWLEEQEKRDYFDHSNIQSEICLMRFGLLLREPVVAKHSITCLDCRIRISVQFATLAANVRFDQYLICKAFF